MSARLSATLLVGLAAGAGVAAPAHAELYYLIVGGPMPSLT